MHERSERDTKMSALPRIEKIETIASTKWLSLRSISYTDESGKRRLWDTVTRATKQGADKADAVVIVPLLKRYGQDDEVDTILVEQFRPPVGTSTIEFPAGLIDGSETPEQAAMRELREETGYVGESCKTLPKVSRAVCMSPGITDESVHIVVVVVDLDNPYNKDPKPEPDEGEFIKVKRVPLKDGLQQMLDQGTSMPIEGLYLFALGLDLGKSMSANNTAR
jgi:8-oxo-dGTP pyrophosphatase MutT (NUDIX family)